LVKGWRLTIVTSADQASDENDLRDLEAAE
jgi:hypothetical protein